jgi:[ribosomal protein S5]-alanine N-acetyltransferase
MTLLSSTPTIETERLLLRRMDATDLDFFAAIHADALVAQYLGAGNVRLRAETEQWLSDILDSYRNANLGQLTVIRKSDGIRVGRCGLSDAAVETGAVAERMRRGWFFSYQVPGDVVAEPLPELGYTFGREFWGQGFATEAAGAVFAYAKDALDYPAIMSVIHPDNAGSRAVVLKYGAVYGDMLEMAGRGFERYFWPMQAQ